MRITKLNKRAQERQDEIQKKYMKLISGGMIVHFNCIGTNLNGWIQNLPPKGINLIQFIQTVYLNKKDRTAHWVGNSKLKELDINDFFKIKHMD